ncbi:maternal B9.10 protein-like [Nerophis ophidion]|uniref:maternal B9.10 protein-like n=1 Tax=Nerophis ophidion TaxID=159077 RepID=UPI002ADFF068|nr:maternal B9.10 protein-like [Nerophis ophidion]
MKEEIAAAVFFVARLVKRYGCLDKDSRDRFAAALTSALLESYKNHWHPNAPTKGQAYRCLRMNRVQLQDLVLQKACDRSAVRYEDLGLPEELTLWVDPGEVSCRYGEHSAPFSISAVVGCGRRMGEFSRRIHDAVERASLGVASGSSSEEEEEDDDDDDDGDGSSSGNSVLSSLCPPANPEPKTIPTVNNPNSVYRFSEFALGAPKTWLMYPKRKAFMGDVFQPPAPPPPPGGPAQQLSGQKGLNPYRATFTFSGPRVDKYHWVSKYRS